MDKIEWETPLLALVPQLRRLQYAANSLNYHEFCEAMGWPRDDYTKAKFVAFQAFGKLGVFDDSTLSAPVLFYERREERYAAERKTREERMVETRHAKPCATPDCVVTGDHDAHYTAGYLQGTLPGGVPESNPSAVYATERGEARHTKGGPARD